MASCGPGQSEKINRNRFIQASQGVNTCLPDDSGAQSISSGLLTTCTTGIQAAGVFALQTWKAICWLWSEIQSVQAEVAAIDVSGLETEIAENTAAIAALEAAAPPVHVGTPTFTVNEAVAGTGASATIQTGSTDLKGGVTIVLGTGPTAAGGNMGDLIFGTQFAAVIFPALGAGPKIPGGVIANALVSNNGPITSMNLYVYAPAANLAQSNVIKIFWNVGFTS